MRSLGLPSEAYDDDFLMLPGAPPRRRSPCRIFYPGAPGSEQEKVIKVERSIGTPPISRSIYTIHLRRTGSSPFALEHAPVCKRAAEAARRSHATSAFDDSTPCTRVGVRRRNEMRGESRALSSGSGRAWRIPLEKPARLSVIVCCGRLLSGIGIAVAYHQRDPPSDGKKA